MSKKSNTVLLQIGGVVFLLAFMIVCFLAFAVPLVLLINAVVAESDKAVVFSIGTFVLLIGCMILSYFVYGKIMQTLMKRIDFDKYFEPIFKRRQPKKPRDV